MAPGGWDTVDIKRKVMSNAERLHEDAQACEGVAFEHMDLIHEEWLDAISRSHSGLTADERGNRADTGGMAREQAAVPARIRRAPDVRCRIVAARGLPVEHSVS